MSWIRSLPILFASILLTGCAIFAEEEDRTRDWSVQKLYSEAKSALNNADYESAVKYYEILQARFPFGAYAQQAQVELIYAYYKDGESELAISEADRFIKMHPRHPNVDYVYYLRGLINFNRNYGLLERYLPMDASHRDQAAARQSFFDFQSLVSRFPESRYAEDSRQRMLFLRNNVARYEINVATYYLERGAYVAAANRARVVVENYQGADVMPEALTVMAIAYKLLELPDLAADALRVLKQNYPDHQGVSAVTEARIGEKWQRRDESPWWQL